MSILHFLSKSRGTRNLTSRIITVLRRFGISSKKFENLLKTYYDVTNSAGYVPTFAITAAILARHPDFIRELSHKGVEFAVHGYVHIDYQELALDDQVEHFKKAMDIFKIYEIPFTGFRAPFLRVNGHTSKVLKSLGFAYDSSRIMHWDVVDLTKYSRYKRSEYDRLLEFYRPRDANAYLALPRVEDDLIQIPVVIPDDEALMDRLGITDKKKITEIWKYIFQKTYSRGELFTLGLHPERIQYCGSALMELLQIAGQANPPIWVVTLNEITEWWKEKEKFSFQLNSQGDGRFGVKADCSDRATVLLKNCEVNVPVNECFDGYKSVTARDFVLESQKRPVIGVSEDSSPAAVSFLQSEGYIVEQSSESDNYGIYLDNLAQFNEAAEKPLYHKIEQSDSPLLRYWRWPDQARSAFSVTGDIDSMTVLDFVLRIFENLRERRQKSRALR